MAHVEGHQRLEAYTQRVRSILPRLACFDALDYLALHADLAASDPYWHFAEHGIWEKRRCITPERLTAKLSRATALAAWPTLTAQGMELAYQAAICTTGVIHLPSQPSDSDLHTAERLAAIFYEIGLDVPIRRGAPESAAVGAIIISPERQFTGDRGGVDLELLRRALVVVGVSPDTAAFGEQLPYILGAAGVLAIESETYVLCQEAEIPAVWLGAIADGAPDEGQPAAHPLYFGLARTVRDAVVPLDWADRPIDVLAIEAGAPARAAAWARMSDGMARFNTVVYQPPSDGAVEEEEGALRRYLYARSKIILHLHAETPKALSSLLIQEAATAGAVVLSEPAGPHLLMKPGRHYFESSARRMPALVDQIINQKGGPQRAVAVRDASRSALACVFDPDCIGLALINLLTEAERAAHD